jgi:DNA-binding transcriptional ArsR family regulator
VTPIHDLIFAVPKGDEGSGRRPDLGELDDAERELRALARAMTHPVRTAILVELTRKPGLGADELSRVTEEPPTAVRRHLRQLFEAGLVDVTREESRRGTMKRYYQTVDWPLQISPAEEARLPRSARVEIALRVLCEIVSEARRSLEAGAFLKRPDRVLGWRPTVVDRRGWEELAGIQAEALSQIDRVCEESARRLAGEGDDPVAICAALLLFEVPGGTGSSVE